MPLFVAANSKTCFTCSKGYCFGVDSDAGVDPRSIACTPSSVPASHTTSRQHAAAMTGSAASRAVSPRASSRGADHAPCQSHLCPLRSPDAFHRFPFRCWCGGLGITRLPDVRADLEGPHWNGQHGWCDGAQRAHTQAAVALTPLLQQHWEPRRVAPSCEHVVAPLRQLCRSGVSLHRRSPTRTQQQPSF